MGEYKNTTTLEKYKLQVLTDAVRDYVKLIELPHGARHRRCVLTFKGTRFCPVDIQVHFVTPMHVKDE